MGWVNSARRFAVALGALLAWSSSVLALNPALDVSQYAHDSWKYRDGLAKGDIRSIAQTPDGYLWLSTEFGLVRFDGVRGVPWEPPPGQHLPSSNVIRVLPARDGTLWIGTRNGLASWKNEKLTQYPDFAGLLVSGLAEDRESTIWVSALGLPTGKFCEIRLGNVRCYPEVGGPNGVWLHEDATGNVWAEQATGVWRWKPGPPKFYPLSVLKNVNYAMADGEDGTLLLTLQGGVGQFADGNVRVAYPFPVGMRGILPNRVFRDRDGGLWVGSNSGGIVHFHRGHTDVYTRSDGLTGDSVAALFEDREGNVWVATRNGLDRFRELPVTTYSIGQGFSNSYTSAVLGPKDGSIWAVGPAGLDRSSREGVTAFRLRREAGRPVPREIAVSGMPDSALQSLLQDSHGRIWVSSTSAVGYLEGDRLSRRALLAASLAPLRRIPLGIYGSPTRTSVFSACRHPTRSSGFPGILSAGTDPRHLSSRTRLKEAFGSDSLTVASPGGTTDRFAHLTPLQTDWARDVSTISDSTRMVLFGPRPRVVSAG
jgi:streptogramin lyase